MATTTVAVHEIGLLVEDPSCRFDLNMSNAIINACTQHCTSMATTTVAVHEIGLLVKDPSCRFDLDWSSPGLTPDLRQLHEEAKEAGITVLNELGLDPGIDHLLANQVIDEVNSSDGRITSLVSYCCSSPTPDFTDNPLGYKFGWNQVGAFEVIMNGARWKENNLVHQAEPGRLMEHARNVDVVLRGFSLEAFPNRDSLEYQSLYNSPDARTIIRGHQVSWLQPAGIASKMVLDSEIQNKGMK